MKAGPQNNKKFYEIVFVFLCIICLAILVSDVHLVWENIQIEKKIQLLLESFGVH